MKIVKCEKWFVARSFSFLWFKRIYVGEKMSKLPADQQMAVLAHEEGHCEHHHTEKRLLALFFPFMLQKMCHRHEMEADRYAAMQGHASPLIKFIRRCNQGPYHPNNECRIEALKKFVVPSLDPRYGSSSPARRNRHRS